MQVKAELNPLVESDLWLSGAVNIAGILRLHCTRLMVKHCLYHTISDRLGHNMLSILRAIDLQLGSNVGECDTAVGKADRSHRSLDHIVMKANNKAVGEVGLELGGKLLHNTVKPSDIASLHSLGELKVGGQRRSLPPSSRLTSPTASLLGFITMLSRLRCVQSALPTAG